MFLSPILQYVLHDVGQVGRILFFRLLSRHVRASVQISTDETSMLDDLLTVVVTPAIYLSELVAFHGALHFCQTCTD